MSDELKDGIKAELLALGEETAAAAVEHAFNIIELVIKDTDNKFDDLLLPIMPKLKEVVLSYVDKIDPNNKIEG